MTTVNINTVEEHLTNVGHISAREAMLDYGIMSLRDVVYRLRQKGYNIISEERHNPVTNKKYIRYWLSKNYRNRLKAA
jgi:hypothetical protein